MIITPGVNATSILDQVTMIRLDSKRPVSIIITDNEGNPVDIDETMDASGNARGELDLEVVNICNELQYSETYFPVPIPDDRRITKTGTGTYQILWGDEDNETDSSGPLVFCWHARQTTGSEDIYRTQLVEVVSARTLSMLPRFRLLMDKSLKVVVPEEYCNLGYTDAQLVVYLQAGLARINAAQPYPSWLNIDAFPLETNWELLTRAGLLFGLDSQLMFAVDTDIPAYSDNGHAFQLSHFAQLKSLRDSISVELSRDIQAFKLHYVGGPQAAIQFHIGLGFYQMISSAPPGSLFRKTYTMMGG